MRQFILVILFVQCLTNFCAGELSTEKKDLYLNGFIDYLNSLPNQAFAYEDGVILNAEESTDNGYKIEARIKANDLHNLDTFKYVKCTGTVRDAGETEVSVDAYQCQDEEETQTQADIEEEVTNETPLEHEPVKLDNEVQTDTAVTSGEQFVAVPRGQGSAPCIGCASPVNPEAAGVPELASLGVTQLNEYEPNVAHTLNKVVSVERQVQVVNGVRYILTLLVDYNSCSSAVTETCMATKPCKVSVLEKPWVKLPDGSKYRRIVSNNCTNDWIFREHESNSSKNDGDNAGAIDEMVSFVHNKDVQSQPGLDKALTDDDIKKIQEQIISHDHFKQSLANSNDQKVPTEDTNTNDFTKQQNFYIESQKTLGKNAEDVVKNSDTVPSNDINLPGSQVVPNGLSTDQKKTIDDLMNFFDFSNFNPKPEDKQNTLRIKRSFDNDLKVFRLAEKFSEIKKTIKNTKYLYTLAEAMVTYLNEIDMEIKNRVVKNVLSAEEESDVTQHFYYLQVLVEIPCQKVQCDNDKLNKICNGVIDTTHETNPQVLNVFCYDMKKNATNWGRMYHVPDSDPILRNMAISALKKIESESPDENALKLIKIINGNTQKVHGILTKITVLIGYTKCKKTENFAKRSNCTVDRDMGTKICDIDVLQRRWLKENKITYVCTERPASESFVDSKKTDTNVNDRSVQEIVQEALQFLEVQSNRNNKQKVVEIKSVSTQLVAGLLTNIDFTVGYTICTNEFDVDVENCKLIKSEPLRHCQAQVWHRPWLEDGRQMNVSCKNTKTSVPEQDNLPDQELIESLRNKRETHFANYSERQREKRQIAGGETEENPNDPKYLALAEESLQQYMQTTGNTQPHSVTKVDSVRTQVVAGFLTKIVFTVIAGNSDVIQCYSEVWERPWLSKKEITVNCGMKNQVRQKREDIIAGGDLEQNPNDPKYLALAEESLQQYIRTTGNTQPHSVTKVDRVRTQVVAGTLTKIDFTVNAVNSDVIQCHSEVWERPWLNKKEITVNCGIENQVRQKREDIIMGGEMEQNPNDPEYLALAEEALKKYIQTSGSTQPHSVMKVDKVTTQVVTGVLTRIDFTVTVGNSDVIQCHSEVLEPPGADEKEITVNCGNENRGAREKRQVPGGEVERDPNDPKYLALAKESLQKYIQTSGSTQPHSVTKVDRVTTAVVSGTLTKIDFTVNAGNSDVIQCHSEVWERPWLNKKEITVHCGIENQVKQKREDIIMGGEMEQNPNDPEYLALAEEALKKYIQTSGSTQPHSVMKVDKVTTQVVTGVLTRIDFTVTVGNSDVIQCHSEVLEPPGADEKEITVNCGNENRGAREKRQVPGGEVERDPNDPKYLALAKESLQKYIQTSGSTQPHSVTKVDRVTTAVVSGTLTKIDFTVNAGNSDVIQCHSEVWERPWLNKKEITVHCGIENQVRQKREDIIMGGEMEQNPNDPEYLALAEEALKKYIQTSGSTQPHSVMKVDKVTTQVVTGVLTRIDFTVTVGNSDVIQCHSEVLEPPGADEKEITVNCGNENRGAREKRQVPGGEVERDPNDPKYLALAKESLQKYIQTSGSTQPHSVTKVDRVTTAVVSGTLTKIDFTVNAGNSDVIQCHSEVWERPWLNKKEITVHCGIENQVKQKREDIIMGGEMEQNPNDPEYLALAEEALKKYIQTSGSTQPHSVMKVDKVTTQVVTGVLTRIDFTVTVGNSDVIQCHSEVLEPPGADEKEITVNCGNENRGAREKRQVPGGEVERDPNDPKYLALAKESLQKYIQTSGSTQPHSVTKVDRVTTAVVSGSLTKIDFTVNAGNSDVIQCHSVVWEQPWLNKKEITVNCGMKNQIRQKREDIIMGGEMEQNPNDPEYLALAEEALKKYIQTSGSTQPHSVTKVDKVTTQVVTGVLTRIDFTVNVGNSDVIQCHSEVLEPPGADEKEITVNCGMKNQIRQKREVTFTGGDLEHNPNDPKYLALAEESLQQYIQTTGNTQPHSVTKVDRVRTQVVSGTLTKIDFTVNVGISDVIHCHSRVWEQAWLSKKEITVNCGSDENKLREKRQAPGDRLSGAPIAQDHTLPEYLSLAKTCLKVYLQNKNSTQHHKVIEVKEVTTQVVAGVMTRLTFLVSPTNCQIDNKGVPSAESCEILDKTDVRRCFAKVWDKPWKSERTISVDCKLSRSKREIFADRLKTHNRRLITNMGSEVEQDASKAEYRTLAEESLRKYQRLQKSEVIHTVLEVKRVFTKLVSGTIYKIDFTAQPSKCSKNTLNVSSCSQLHENQTIYCQSEVWDRPWLKRKDIEVDCYTDNHNINEEELNHEEDKEDTPLKGGLLGGSAPQDKTAERFKIIANAATRKFESSGKTKYVHKVVKINEATEQIIDGNLVIVKFTVSPTTCLIKDAITDVDKCPIDNNEIKLQCTARVLEQIALEFDEDKMRVSCKRKHQTHIDRQKRSIDVREKRQNRFYDEEIDEETKYYYADKAVQYLNDHSSTHNVQKLITIHSVQNSMHMKVPMVRMYLETAYTYCLRDEHQQDLHLCDELDGMAHRLCLAKLFPAAEDELIVHKVYVVCDDDTDFTKTTGLAISELVAVSVLKLENSPNIKYKLVHQGEPNVAPSLDMKLPVKLHFIVASTNCTKDQDPKRDNVACYIDTTRTAKSCISYIWIVPNEKRISRINVKCNEPSRRKRSLSNDTVSTKSDEARIKQLVQASLEKLEMSSLHRYKQRVLLINSYSTKITTGKVTTIDFDVGYTNCLKYEWIDNITKCEFLEHLPRRHCVSQVWERLWIKNGRNIEVNCEDDETPLESRIEFESAETAMQLAKHSLKHIEAKYPHPKKQQVVRIFSLEKQAVAGMHYRMKLEVGFTNCSALSFESGCTLINDGSMNRFCRVNVWLRTWTNHPPIYRVSCDYQDGTSTELYHHIQAEQLFYNFLTTYKPDYVNDHVEMAKRFDIFKDNIRKIHELNIYELGTATYTVNRFTDLTQEEFSSKYLGLKPSLRDANQVPMPEAKIPKVDVPEAFDWRTYGAVTPVKDQGSCGSCWAFSVTGNIEGQWKIQTGDLISLSEQELVDCDKLDHGCNGGLPDNAYRAVEELGGLETKNDYPYEGEDDKCSYNKTLSRVHISGAVNISSNETEMAQWLVHNGPISIGINANAMQFYRAGISHPWKALCNPDNLDHGVLIVGFGVKDYPLFHKRLPYWIVKNSWGASWGEEGYYRVYRGDGTCGVNKMASSAVV
ncbi:hypothetical protein ABMA27_007612 [Loxostege sticticalis]|uniref:Uncharacterized protein n=2 Tax=Loxostege sticticalis TaxID=481309 RepID=A0ABR3HG18_LOXSC